jgi:hypothetical protein
MTVWRKGTAGWEQARISGQVFYHDCWYVTTVPGSTYVAHGHQLCLDRAEPSALRLASDRALGGLDPYGDDLEWR